MTLALLVKPSLAELPSYVAALERGWSPDNMRQAVADEHLHQIAADAQRFLASLDDSDAAGEPIQLPDGSIVPRLPGFTRWIWDGEICGTIGLRWQPGTSALPPHVLGHIGYCVVPWKQRRGYATHALTLLLPESPEPRPCPCRTDHRSNKSRLAARHPGLRRSVDRALLQTRSLRRRRGAAVPDRVVVAPTRRRGPAACPAPADRARGSSPPRPARRGRVCAC